MDKLLSAGLLYCYIISAFGDSRWIDEPHFYTIYLEESTWNDAREYCRSSDKQLLSVANKTDLQLWTEMLNHTRRDEHRSAAGIYWTGLHAPDQGAPDLYFWDDCTVPKFFGPDINDSRVNDRQCVAMLVTTDAITDALFDTRLKSFMCNETHPFICTSNLNDSGCIESCDELVVLTEHDVCDTLCENSACHTIYINHLHMCHVIPSSYASIARVTLCYLQSVDYTPSVCEAQSVDSLVLYNTDTNMNVTDTVCLLQQSEVNNSAVTDNCSCLCEKLWTFLSAAPPEVVNLTVEEKVDIIVQELTVDKKNTTLNQRKYVSVMDYRTSSMSLGIVAGVIILSVIGVIIIIDLSTIWTEISNFLIKMFKVLKPPKSRIKTPIDGHAGKEDVTPNVAAEDFGNREKNTENSENISINNISGVGWFLRERLVYRDIASENTKLELASSETNDKNIRMSSHSALTSEV